MSYDHRLLSPTSSSPRPSRRPGRNGSIELGPWASSSPEFFEPPPQTYSSTTKLLSQAREHVYQISPPRSIQSVDNIDEGWVGWKVGALLCVLVVAAALVLNVVVTALRNLTYIKRPRMVLWVLLAASSVPLHLMFNSALFVSLTANEYVVATVSEDFVSGANWSLPDTDLRQQSIIGEMQQNISSYDKLDISTCIKQYGVDYLSDRRHVLAVVSGQFPDPLLGFLDWNYAGSLNSWVCGTSQGPNSTLETISIDDFDCSIPVALANSTWLMADVPVKYCLSQKVPDQCRLQFAVPIMLVVLVCNAVKLTCMAITLWKFNEPTFVTLGDALGGLLENPDPHTAGMCTATKKDFLDGAWPDPEPRKWTVKRHFRFEAVGTRRWVLSNAFCAMTVIALSILLRFAIGNTTTASDITTLWDLGFGTVTPSSMIRWSTPVFGNPGLMKNVLLANSPQIILSVLYIAYNRVYTCMSSSKEWHDLAHHRRSLRVTAPRGQQRSSYFLSLPYRYLVPILIVSVATHWILSQSLFLVAIDVYDEYGNFDPSQSILSCGFSCIALIFLIGIGWSVLIAGVGLGLRRYEPGMPLAGSCSAALSASCHPPVDERDVSIVPLMWGVTSVENGVGHCALSRRYVSPPVTGRRYQGLLGE
ncbi:hypothetical protein EG329_012441 [Mollisiaceae sp. DMI_Dod_QoI]|nr:hypothetical protein EG329_012441 [Helotiales sp. DMI_Dod_QoI]